MLATPDDVERDVVQRQLTANDGGVSVEPLLPEPVAKHREARLPLGGAFLFGKGSSDGRADANHFEEVGGHRSERGCR